jgi:hypothetical protein
MTYTTLARDSIGSMREHDTFEGITAQQIERAKGLTLVRWLAASDFAQRHVENVHDVFERTNPHDLNRAAIMAHREKAAVGGLVASSPAAIVEAFIRSATSAALLGRLQLRRVPFLVPVGTTTLPAAFAWRGEGLPARVVLPTYTPGDALAPTSASGIVVVSREALSRRSPVAEAQLLADLRAAYVAWLDRQFCDPSVAGDPGISPGSITNGLTPIASSGGQPADAVEDLRQLHAAFVGGGGKVESAVLLMSSANSVALNLADPERFGTLTRDGGTLGGLPVIASDAVGSQVVMADTSQIALADDGQADVSISTQTDIEMSDAPSQSGVTGTGANLVSLWQTTMAAVRIDRVINWRAPEGAVQRVSGALYYAAGSPMA